MCAVFRYFLPKERHKVIRWLLLIAAAVFAEPGHGAASETPADAVNECDKLAAHPLDPDKPESVVGQFLSDIDAKAASMACEAALRAPFYRPRITYQLGRAYLALGEEEKAEVHFTKAGRQGYGMAVLSNAYIFQVRGDKKSALISLKQARKAIKHDTPAHLFVTRLIGIFYAVGYGTSANPPLAFEFLHTAAQYRNRGIAIPVVDEGLRISEQLLIALFYYFGFGTEQDLDAAHHWYAKAYIADPRFVTYKFGQALFDGYIYLGFGSLQFGKSDESAALPYLTASSEFGNVAADSTLANYHYLQALASEFDPEAFQSHVETSIRFAKLAIDRGFDHLEGTVSLVLKASAKVIAHERFRELYSDAFREQTRKRVREWFGDRRNSGYPNTIRALEDKNIQRLLN
jgi:tetratricopeptide (TPR) repeat protein